MFEYDYENQLTNVYVASAWKSEFRYDAFGRKRVQKDYGWTGSAWSLTNEVRYIYDGMLVVQERNANNVALVSYTRGNDLSGSLQGAGGIGGLLARTDHATLIAQPSAAHSYYHADGNGNITALVNSNGIVVARYNYDPYGNMLGMDGSLAAVNSYRFSSKEWHNKAGLCYYGFRLYDPNLQRWVSADPMGEQGGINLYQFNFNNSIQLIEPFGLAPNKQEACNSSDIADFLKNNPNLADLRDESLSGNQRYFYTEEYGWVDVRHFAETARRVQNGEPGWVTRALGFGNEIAQWLGEWGDDYRSGFSYEDLPSNDAGIDFAQNISPLDKDLAESFTKWASKNRARSTGDDRSGFVNLPETDPNDPGGKGGGSNSNSSKKNENPKNSSCP